MKIAKIKRNWMKLELFWMYTHSNLTEHNTGPGWMGIYVYKRDWVCLSGKGRLRGWSWMENKQSKATNMKMKIKINMNERKNEKKCFIHIWWANERAPAPIPTLTQAQAQPRIEKRFRELEFEQKNKNNLNPRMEWGWEAVRGAQVKAQPSVYRKLWPAIHQTAATQCEGGYRAGRRLKGKTEKIEIKQKHKPLLNKKKKENREKCI